MQFLQQRATLQHHRPHTFPPAHHSTVSSSARFAYNGTKQMLRKRLTEWAISHITIFNSAKQTFSILGTLRVTGQSPDLFDEPDLHHPLPGKLAAAKHQCTVKKMGQVFLRLLLVPFGPLPCPRNNYTV